MPMSSEPKEIAKARELLKEFEKSPGLLKKSCFSKAMVILNDFLNEHPDSEFSKRADNLKKIYIKLLVKRLGTIPFSNIDDWVNALAWVFKIFPEEERKKFETTPELKEHWHNFVNFITFLI